MTAPVIYHFIRNATARLHYNGQVLLLDPMLSDKGTLPSFAGVAPNPTADLPLPAAEVVDGIDAAIVSHLHGDHFDSVAADLLDKDLPVVTPTNTSPVETSNPDVVQSFKEGLMAKGFTDVREIEAEPGGALEIGGITLRQVFALHGKGKLIPFMGGVNGIIFEAAGQPTIYWAGDTILDDGGEVAAVLTECKPDIIIAHTGGPVIEGLSPDLLLMDAAEARRFFDLAFDANPNVQIVAIHMDALDHCFSTRTDLETAVADMPAAHRARVHIPADGDRLTLA